MIVLHGAWLPATCTDPGRFALWGETAASGRPAPGGWAAEGAGAALPHPFAASVDQLRAACGPLVPDHGAAPRAILARLPGTAGGPLPSPELARDGAPGGDDAPALGAWQVEALLIDADAAPEWLLALAAGEGAGEGASAPIRLGADLRCWISATRFALDLLYRERYLPAIRREGAGYAARWRPLLDDERDARRVRALAAGMPPAGRALAWTPDAPEPGPQTLLGDFLEAIVDAVARAAPGPTAAPHPAGQRRERAPGEAWLAALHGDPVLAGDSGALAALYAEYRAWMERAAAAANQDSFRVCFRLSPPFARPEDAEAVSGPRSDRPWSVEDASGAPAPRSDRKWTVEYLLQATDDPSLLVPAAEVWQQGGASLRFLNRQFEGAQERLLAGLGLAARLFPPLEASLHTAHPRGATLSVDEAYTFIREAALAFRASGFGVLIPGLESKLGLRLKLGAGKGRKPAQAGSGLFGMDRLVGYDWQVALGDQTLTREEFLALARLKEPLVEVRGRWIELRPELIEQALALFGSRRDTMPLPEALRLALAPDGRLPLPLAGVVAEGPLAEMLRALQDGGPREAIAEPAGFHGQLRPYQKAGVGWLAALRRYGLGACLADDMGLGKTIQLIALILHEREAGRGTGPALLICPTSVVGNWRRELARFAPDLRVLVHHGAARNKETFAAEAAAYDVVISTYALLHRDEPELSAVEWEYVVLDEAQNIKNAATKAAQAARRIPARWRAALTGTPVENRLAELWSIFQFLNPGYLGSLHEFQARFARPIERENDPAAAAQLKALTAPFILRRLKTDRAIIADLPEKNEMKVYCTLTREQATLYEAVVQDALRKIAAAEGLDRLGQVLALLTKLKQVCDHPALFLHDGSALAGRSGKLARLTEMLEEVLAVGDRALLFTQYAEMGRLLQGHLEAAFGGEVCFLHGGTPAEERDRLVTRFQNDEHAPHLFILSLKAGGIGLNLTRANHVFHFDRWWNPAVENQATDRAFRIGQRRDIEVHKFISAGTFEEAIDELIEKKRGLSEAIVGAGETWIGELSTAELRGLFALRPDAVEEE